MISAVYSHGSLHDGIAMVSQNVGPLEMKSVNTEDARAAAYRSSRRCCLRSTRESGSGSVHYPSPPPPPAIPDDSIHAKAMYHLIAYTRSSTYSSRVPLAPSCAAAPPAGRRR